MSDPSSFSGAALDVEMASALDGAASDVGELDLLLRAATARIAPDPALHKRFRDSTRAPRLRICRGWLLVLLVMMGTTGLADVIGLPTREMIFVTSVRLVVLVLVLFCLALMPRVRSDRAENLLALVPCLAMILGGGISGAFCGPSVCGRYEAFIATTICSALIFTGAGRRVHVLLIAVTALAMCGFGTLSGLPWTDIAEDASFWLTALVAFSWAGHMQEQQRYGLFVHRLERDVHLRKVSAISDSLFRGARTDALTRIGNRLLLDERLSELAAAGDRLRELWVLMVDVDHFKQLNDALGHAAGDECLRMIAATLGSCLRSDDVLARYGGEEFVALVRAPEVANAWSIAERMREAVSGLPLSNPRTPMGHVTISIGVAAVGTGGVATALGRADAALYAAKGAGRDRVSIEPGCADGAIFAASAAPAYSVPPYPEAAPGQPIPAS